MKRNYRTSSPTRLAALLAGAALFGLVSQSALAAGTASGTTINNLAKLSYSVGGTAQNEICSSPTGNGTGNGGTSGTTCVSGTNGATNTSFVVDNKVNLTVAKVSDLTTVPGTTSQALAFTVTNNGNTTQRYKLSAVAGAATISTMSNVKIYLDVNGNGAWDAGDTLYVDASTFGNVAADGSLKILIVADTPVTATNGQTAVFNLEAQTVDAGSTTVTTQTAGGNTAGVDVVFADIATSGTDAGDVARDGKHSANATYTVGTSVLSVTKTVTVLCDPFNGNTNPKNIPGAIVQYAITITNAVGGTTATLSTVADALAGALSFDTKLISGAGAVPATACSSGGTSLSASGYGAVWGTGTTTTTYAAPGSAAQAVTAGAAFAAGATTITYGSLTGGTGLSGSGGFNGTLPGNSFVTVYYNAYVQ